MIELVEIATTRAIRRRVSILVAYGVREAYIPVAPTSGRLHTIQFIVNRKRQ